MFSVRSGARNEVESRSRASTWLKRLASGATPAAAAVSAATWQVVRQEQAAAGVEYHLVYPSKWAIGKPAKSTRCTFSQPASRTAPSGSVPSVLVSSLFIFLLASSLLIFSYLLTRSFSNFFLLPVFQTRSNT